MAIDRKFYKTVVDFFKNSRKKPVQSEWFTDDNKGCCAVAAAVLVMRPNLRDRRLKSSDDFAEILGKNKYFIKGVTKGFDGYSIPDWAPDKEKDQMAKGYETGKALLKKLIHDLID